MLRLASASSTFNRTLLTNSGLNVISSIRYLSTKSTTSNDTAKISDSNSKNDTTKENKNVKKSKLNRTKKHSKSGVKSKTSIFVSSKITNNSIKSDNNNDNKNNENSSKVTSSNNNNESFKLKDAKSLYPRIKKNLSHIQQLILDLQTNDPIYSHRKSLTKMMTAANFAMGVSKINPWTSEPHLVISELELNKIEQYLENTYNNRNTKVVQTQAESNMNEIPKQQQNQHQHQQQQQATIEQKKNQQRQAAADLIHKQQQLSEQERVQAELLKQQKIAEQERAQAELLKQQQAEQERAKMELLKQQQAEKERVQMELFKQQQLEQERIKSEKKMQQQQQHQQQQKQQQQQQQPMQQQQQQQQSSSDKLTRNIKLQQQQLQSEMAKQKQQTHIQKSIEEASTNKHQQQSTPITISLQNELPKIQKKKISFDSNIYKIYTQPNFAISHRAHTFRYISYDNNLSIPIASQLETIESSQADALNTESTDGNTTTDSKAGQSGGGSGHDQSSSSSSSSESTASSIFNMRNLIIFSVLSGGAYYYYFEDGKKKLLDSSQVRNLRVILTGFLVTFYYKYYLYGLQRGDPEFNEQIKIANKLASEALVDLCKKNKGIFIKFAQIIASLDHILPTEYITALSVFQDHAPYEQFSEVVRLFKEETGLHPDDIFIDFQREPIASASLAQVHKANIRLPNGELEEVAVKVQYPDLNERFEKDIESIFNVMVYINWFFPRFEFSWILPEATSCLNQELDFINEAKNSEKIASLFTYNKQLYIPKIHWDKTTKRILTMEFIHGCRIDDKKGLARQGINTEELYYLFSEVFAEQIFIHGFLHSDPHPGNILVRNMPNGKPQMVLLDHGLYKQIDENVRINFCYFWKSVCTGDIKASEHYARQLGAGDYAKYLGILLNLRPEKSRENLRNMKRELGDQTLLAITEILKNLPKEILLVLKTNNLIRQITSHFKIENGFMLMAKSCIKGIYQSNDLVSVFKYYYTLFMFKVTIKFVTLAAKWSGKDLQPTQPMAFPHH